MARAFIIGLLAVTVLAVVIVSSITAVWVTKKVKERLAANRRHKVIFADTRETIDTYIREQKEKQQEYSADDLEKMCQDAPYVFADYDIDTDEVVNYTAIHAETIDPDVKRKLKERGGIVAFDS